MHAMRRALLLLLLLTRAAPQTCAAGYFCPLNSAPRPCACAAACPDAPRNVTVDNSFSGIGYLWTVSTIAGTGAWASPSVNGIGTVATFNNPSSMGIDLRGGPNKSFVVLDYAAHVVRPVTWPAMEVSLLVGGDLTTGAFADGTNPSAVRFNQLRQGALAPDTIFYVADGGNNRLRRVWPNGTTNTFAGNGTAGSSDGPQLLNATFKGPVGLALDVNNITGEYTFYVADTGNNAIRRIKGGAVTTLAGNPALPGLYADGVGSAARFFTPYSIALSADGALLFVADRANNRVRVVETATGSVRTIAGNGTAGFLSGLLNGPTGMSFHASGALVVAEISAHRIRLVSSITGQTLLVGGAFTGATGYADSATGDGSKFNTCAAVSHESGTVHMQCRMRGGGRYCGPSVTYLGSGSASGHWRYRIRRRNDHLRNFFESKRHDHHAARNCGDGISKVHRAHD